MYIDNIYVGYTNGIERWTTDACFHTATLQLNNRLFFISNAFGNLENPPSSTILQSFELNC